MYQQVELVPRKERHKLGKRKSRAYSLLIEDGKIEIHYDFKNPMIAGA